MPIHFAVSQNFSPYAPSRSRSKYRGAWSHWECFQKLTGCPFCCGVRGHREMNRTSPVLIENHKDE
jgi:hypothetical protein